MRVVVNGEPMEIESGATLEQLLGELKVRRQFTAVALNREVAPRAAYATTILCEGDRVEIVIDAGGTTKSYEIVATRAGRRVEVSIARGVAEVAEVTRSGTAVRTARFMASKVIALVEHPAARAPLPEERKPPTRLPTAGTA